MAVTHDVTFTSVSELRQRIDAGELSPVELTDACLERIATLDPEIGAFVLVLEEEARAAARDSEARVRSGEARPLEGIPIPIKDLAIVAGTPATFGSRLGLDFPMGLDSEVVARLRRAGAVIIGKTHMPEFGSTASSTSTRFGTTRNPWDPSRTPGGSSSGAAAAVAAGMVPAAHGADGGGSLRIPAACTGLFTIKPTRGRISFEPVGDVVGFDTFGFLTRTVLDNALLVDVVEGFVPGDEYWSSPLERPLAEEVGADPGQLRIGWSVKAPVDAEVDPAIAAAVEDAARLCESLGHHVEPHELDWRDDEIENVFLNVWAAQFGAAVDTLRRFGSDPEMLEPHNHVLWEMSKSVSGADYLVSRSRVKDFCRRLTASWERFDVVLTPIMTRPPLPVDEFYEEGNPIAPLSVSSRWVPFTAFFNVSGQPAASLPLHWQDGLPIGVQAVGPMGGEALLYRLAAQLEEARPWAHRRPG